MLKGREAKAGVLLFCVSSTGLLRAVLPFLPLQLGTRGCSLPLLSIARHCGLFSSSPSLLIPVGQHRAAFGQPLQPG